MSRVSPYFSADLSGFGLTKGFVYSTEFFLNTIATGGWWVQAMTAVGLPGPSGATRQKFYGFHDLRRANASEMADATDARTAQTRMGHSDIRLTLQVYAHRSTVADRAAGDALGEHFFSGSRDGRGMESPFGAAVGDGTAPTRDYSEPESGFEPLTYALRVRCSTD